VSVRTAGIRRQSGRPVFNGLHLRLEADAAAWIEMFGGLKWLWQRYMSAAKAAGFDTKTPLVRVVTPAKYIKSPLVWHSRCTVYALCFLPGFAERRAMVQQPATLMVHARRLRGCRQAAGMPDCSLNRCICLTAGLARSF